MVPIHGSNNIAQTEDFLLSILYLKRLLIKRIRWARLIGGDVVEVPVELRSDAWIQKHCARLALHRKFVILWQVAQH